MDRRWRSLSLRHQRERTASSFVSSGAKLPDQMAMQVENCLFEACGGYVLRSSVKVPRTLILADCPALCRACIYRHGMLRTSCSFTANKAYRAKGRKLIRNLMNKENQLRRRLLEGAIAPYSLVRMTDDELARPEVVEQRREWCRQGKFFSRHPLLRHGP